MVLFRGVAGRKCKVYFEATVEDEGLCRVGFSTPEVSQLIVILRHNASITLYNASMFFKASLDLGTCKHGFGFGGTGKKSNNRQFDDYGEPFG